MCKRMIITISKSLINKRDIFVKNQSTIFHLINLVLRNNYQILISDK